MKKSLLNRLVSTKTGRGVVFLTFVVILIPIIVPELLVAGAWVQRKHGLYLKLSTSYLLTTKEFNHAGKRLNIFQERIIFEDTSFRDFGVTAYLEYGLLDRLTLVANIPFKILTSKRTEIIGGGSLEQMATIHTSGLADFALLGRYAILKNPLAISFQGGINIPLGYKARPSNDGPPLGTGNIDVEGHLLIGKSLYPLPAYLTAGLGYRRRTSALHDQILFNVEGGYSIGSVLIKVTLEGLKSTIAPPDIVGQPVITPLPGGGGALPNIIVGDQDLFKVSPSVIYNVNNRIALQGEILHIYAGKNTVSGTIYSLGIIYSK